MNDKQKIILAYNTFRCDLRDNTIKQKIKSEFIMRNKGGQRLRELSEFMRNVYSDKPIKVIPEEIRLTLRELRI